MKEQEVYRIAHELFSESPDWVAFFREVLGLEGIVKQAYPTAEELADFERTTEYAEIQHMLAKLRERSAAVPVLDDLEPTRVITVRMPKSLHEALRAEAHERRTSMNKLCISKLLQGVGGELVPVDRGEEQANPVALYFDLAEFSPAEIAEAISFMSNIYRDVGGDSLVIEGMEVLDSPLVPASMG